MNKIDHEEFDNYLQGDSDLCRAYAKLSEEEPSSDLDNVILEQARHDVKNIPDNVSKIKKSLFTSRLDSPLAMAAVIVLCVSLVLLVPQDEILLETSDEMIPESLPVITDEADQFIQQEPEQKTINKISPAAAIETSKPDVMARDREESFSEKKELLIEAPMEEAEINESRVKERMSEPASAPAYQSDMKQKVQQDQLEDDAEISSGMALPEVVEMEAGVAKRQLTKDSITSDQASPEDLSKHIKLLIQQDKIEEARLVYQRFMELFPEQPLTEWFTDQEMSELI